MPSGISRIYVVLKAVLNL